MESNLGDIIAALAVFSLMVIGPLIFVFVIYKFNKRSR